MNRETSFGQDWAPNEPSNQRKVDIVFVLGPNGSGKGTLVNGLAEHDPEGIKIVASGDMVRAAIKPQNPSPYTKYAEDLRPFLNDSNKGGYIPDDVMIPITAEVVAERILDENTHTIFLDGVIRTAEQLQAYEREIIPDFQQDTDVRVSALHIDAPLEAVMERSEARRQEMLAAGKEPRADDHPETVLRRYQIYMDLTHKPVVEPLAESERINLISIDGTKPKHEVKKEAAKAIFEGK